MAENIEQLYQTITDNILSDIGQCVLIIGPELSVNQEGVGNKSHFKQLIEKYTPGSRYLSSDNLFYFKDEFDENIIRPKVTDFYKNVGDPVLLEMLSRIKFPLIINVCPDEALNKVYDSKGIGYKKGYFSKRSKLLFNGLPLPSKELPVIYNILGTVGTDQSLVFTHTRLYETIEYLLPEKSLPDNIELYIGEMANSFLFLGFKFDSWYYQLICHKLGLHPKKNISSTLLDDDENVSVIMKKSFNMDFTSENAMTCIQNISKICEHDLRPASPTGRYSNFISYAWKDPTNEAREDIVNLIDQHFKDQTDNLFTLFRDKEKLTYGDSINSFMSTIGLGKTVILVISDKYLRSDYCMIEAMRVMEYPDKEKRVFIVMMADAQATINDDKKKDELLKTYKKYWFDKYQPLANDAAGLGKDFDNYVKIYRFINQFIEMISDKLNLTLNYSDIALDAQTGRYAIIENKKGEFGTFMGCVLNKLKEN